ncbi:MAG: metallophosphoesterase family protein [Myxococcota bacterium]
MRIAVISDLHLGDLGASERFGHSDGTFLGFLARLEDAFERVVLLGDIWETATPMRFGRAAEALRASREAHPALAERFAGPRYTWIHGNHDLVAAKLERVPGALRLRADGVRLLFTHGHWFDDFWLRRRALHERASWLVGWLLRLGLRTAVRRLDTLDNALGGIEDAGACPFREAAARAARAQAVDVVVTGHTHVGGCHLVGDRLVLDSGSCSWGRTSFLEIDTGKGVYRLHDRL